MVNLTIYDVIKSTRMSTKASIQNKINSKLIIDVSILANKFQIKKAVEALFGVTVTSINVIIMKGKNKKSMSRFKYKDKDFKKAIVSIKKGSEMGSLQSNAESFSKNNLNFNNA